MVCLLVILLATSLKVHYKHHLLAQSLLKITSVNKEEHNSAVAYKQGSIWGSHVQCPRRSIPGTTVLLRGKRYMGQKLRRWLFSGVYVP